MPEILELTLRGKPRRADRAWQAANVALAEFNRAEKTFRLEFAIAGFHVFGTIDGWLRAIGEETDALDSLAEVRASIDQALTGDEIRLVIREHDGLFVDPAGTLLVDETFTHAPGLQEAMPSLRASLASNVLARPEGEYALVIDQPQRPGALADGLGLARAVWAVLPAEAGNDPKLSEWSLRLSGDQPRVRVWRLGYMKVPSSSRVV